MRSAASSSGAHLNPNGAYRHNQPVDACVLSLVASITSNGRNACGGLGRALLRRDRCDLTSRDAFVDSSPNPRLRTVIDAPRAGDGGGGTLKAHDVPRLVIVAEIRFYREGLALFFRAQDSFEVTGTAEDVSSVAALTRQVRFDVALLDMAMNEALATIVVLKAAAPTAGIVALGVREEEREVVSLAEAGVDGFVSRDASLDDVSRAVESAARGETRCSPRVAGMLARRVASLAHQVLLPDRTGVPLTRRRHREDRPCLKKSVRAPAELRRAARPPL